MARLAIETSLQGIAIGLKKNEAYFYDIDSQPFGYAEKLVSMIDNLLNRVELTYQDLQSIIVTTGPGSFTGIRAGIAAAKGMSLATGCALYSVTTFEAMAEAAKTQGIDKPEVYIDSRRGDYFRQCFEGANITQPQIVKSFDSSKNKVGFDGTDLPVDIARIEHGHILKSLLDMEKKLLSETVSPNYIQEVLVSKPKIKNIKHNKIVKTGIIK